MCLMRPADEAGRGPVLGPMVYGVAVSRIAQAEALKKKEFADSKTLTKERRDQLFESLENDAEVDCWVDSIAAATISAAMLGRQKISLNAIAADSTCRLIAKAIEKGVNLHEVYVDTVGDPASYKVSLV